MNVSIVIPNYNGERYILDCIASIYDQIENKREIIVIDNHSTDQSVAVIQEYFPGVTLIVNHTNTGFAAAVNQGIRASSGKYVILLNNDAIAQVGFVKELYHCMESDPRIFSAGAKMLRYAEPNIIDTAGDELTVLGWAYKTGDGRPSAEYNAARAIFSACAGAAIYRRELFEVIGYFDERFFAYLEDVDIGLRANLYGYRNVFCPSAEVLHIGSATSGSRHNPFKVRLSARNNIMMLVKNYPIGLINLPFILVGCTIKWIFFVFKGLGNFYLKGIIDGIRSIGKGKINTKFKFKSLILTQIGMIKATFLFFFRTGRAGYFAKGEKN
jgi:GT2 family glycosyltransferase